MNLRQILNEISNVTVGRKSKDPDWIIKNDQLDELIKKLDFPVKAFVDVSYGDVFIYVNPKNRKLLDSKMESFGFKYHSIFGTHGVYDNDKNQQLLTAGSNKNGLSQVKVKNKMDVPV